MLMEGDEQVHIANYIRHANGGVMNRYTLQTTYTMLMEGDEQVHIANYVRHANGG